LSGQSGTRGSGCCELRGVSRWVWLKRKDKTIFHSALGAVEWFLGEILAPSPDECHAGTSLSHLHRPVLCRLLDPRLLLTSPPSHIHPHHCFPPHRIASYTAETSIPLAHPQNHTHATANMPKKFPTIVSHSLSATFPPARSTAPLIPRAMRCRGPDRDHAGRTVEPDVLVDDHKDTSGHPASTFHRADPPRSRSRRSSPLPTGRGVTTTVKPRSTGVSRSQRNHKRPHEVSVSSHLLTNPF
jgi:hypothetical protein